MASFVAPARHLPELDGSATRILVVLGGGLPEAILAQGLMAGLQLRHPSARIQVAAPAKHAKAIRRQPAFANLMPFPDGLGFEIDPWLDPDLRLCLSRIQEQRFDLVLAPSPQRAPMADAVVLATEAPLRIGWHSSHLLGSGASDSAGWNAFYTHLVPEDEAPHPEPDRYRHFATKLGLDPGPEGLGWPGDARLERGVRARLSQAGWKGQALVGIWFPPQASMGFSRWSEALGPVLSRGLGVVLLGPGGGRLLTDGSGWPTGSLVMDMRAALPTDEQFECMALCRAVVGEEGPWIYPCAARGVPQVVLAGGGEFGRHAPVTDRATVVCHPLACYFCTWACDQGGPLCLGEIPPDVVGEALRLALDEAPSRPRLIYRLPGPGGAVGPLDLEAVLVPGSVEIIRMN